MRGPTWTPQEIESAQQLIACDATNEECLATLGRSRHACLMKISRWPDQQARTFRMPRPDLEAKPPDHILQDAARRAMAPRSLTARLMGDPATPYSALAQKQGLS